MSDENVKPQPLTVGQLRAALANLTDDMVLSWTHWDSDRDFIFVYGIKDITETGSIRHLIMDGYDAHVDEIEDDEDATEAWAEDVTADAEDAETLYQAEYPETYSDDSKHQLTDEDDL